MAEFRSLADFLGEPEADPSESLPEPRPASPEEQEAFYLESLSGREFADAILSSRIFRRYIIDGMRLGTIPATVMTRFFDYATNWGKPPDRIEHTGRDGRPIETVTEVRRVIVRQNADFELPDLNMPERTH